MDWSDNAEQAEFRAKVASVIETKLPARYSDGESDEEGAGWEADRVSENPDAQQAARDWAGALAEHGWVAPHWPKEYGGAGLTPMEQFIFKMEMAKAAAPTVGGQGVSQLGPTLIVHGTPEQKEEHLTKILDGSANWRQGYSEPGAGSDLASLQTRAIRDGDEYVLNGQKIWTSGAQYADHLYVLARTDPDAPKHRGISFLLMKKGLPGISIRPLIDLSGRHVFNETFFEDVHVPVKDRVGEENRGWYVGMTLLDFERSNITGAVSARRALDNFRGYLKSPDGEKRSPGFKANRLNIVDRYVESEVMFNFSFRIISMQERGLIPNHEASVSKLFNSEMSQKIALTGTRVFGLYAQIYDRKDPRAPMKSNMTRAYQQSVSATIAAGTSEIQRNIIATRGLGLPRG